MKEKDWTYLLNLAIDVLEEANLNINDWTFGGGTALMFYFHHRKSKDVDIFFRKFTATYKAFSKIKRKSRRNK